MDVAHGPVSPFTGPTALKFKTGMIAAALFAAWIGLMAFAIANIASDANGGVNNALKLNPGIGPYSGKEAIWLATWFISWPVLHVALRNRNVNLERWFGVFLSEMFVTVLLMWPAVFEAIADGIKDGQWLWAVLVGILIAGLLLSPLILRAITSLRRRSAPA